MHGCKTSKAIWWRCGKRTNLDICSIVTLRVQHRHGGRGCQWCKEYSPKSRPTVAEWRPRRQQPLQTATSIALVPVAGRTGLRRVKLIGLSITHIPESHPIHESIRAAHVHDHPRRVVAFMLWVHSPVGKERSRTQEGLGKEGRPFNQAKLRHPFPLPDHSGSNSRAVY